jgi:hypothetical protein
MTPNMDEVLRERRSEEKRNDEDTARHGAVPGRGQKTGKT